MMDIEESHIQSYPQLIKKSNDAHISFSLPELGQKATIDKRLYALGATTKTRDPQKARDADVPS